MTMAAAETEAVAPLMVVTAVVEEERVLMEEGETGGEEREEDPVAMAPDGPVAMAAAGSAEDVKEEVVTGPVAR